MRNVFGCGMREYFSASLLPHPHPQMRVLCVTVLVALCHQTKSPTARPGTWGFFLYGRGVGVYRRGRHAPRSGVSPLYSVKHLCVTAPSPASAGAGPLRDRARGIVPPNNIPHCPNWHVGVLFVRARSSCPAKRGTRPYGYLPMPRHNRFNGFKSLSTVRAVFNPDAAKTPPPGCMLAPVIYNPLMGVR